MASRTALRLVRGARANQSRAQFELGRLYLSGGEGLARNPAAACQWLTRAAENGWPEASWLIGEHIPPEAVADPRRVERWYEAAAAAGSKNARVTLAGWLMSGMLGMADRERAETLLTEAAEAGLARAQRLLARLYLERQRADEPDRALNLLARAADQGEAGAQEELSELLWQQEYLDCWQPGEVPGQRAGFMPAAEAVERALRQHEQLLERPPAAKGAEFHYRYAVLLLRAHRREAVRWLARAAEAGHARALYLMGLLHMGPRYVASLAAAPQGVPRGQWLPRNYKNAARWLERAAEADLAEASFALHLLHGMRGFSQRDPAAARKYLRQAAMRGHPEAQYRWGRLLARRGAEGDDLEAVRWLHLAGSQGHLAAGALYQSVVGHAPDVPAGLRAARREAIARVARTHGPLAERLALADAFGLRRHELLLINPVTAVVGEVLVVDVRAAYAKTRRRLIAIETAAQRVALERAQESLPAGRAVPGDVRGSYRQRWRQFHSLCAKLNIDWQLFA